MLPQNVPSLFLPHFNFQSCREKFAASWEENDNNFSKKKLNKKFSSHALVKLQNFQVQTEKF